MNYNLDLIELVSRLAPIQQQMEFTKDDCAVILKGQEENKKIAYKLIAPADYLDFPGEGLRFYEFKRFKNYFDIFNRPNKDETIADVPVLDTEVNDSGAVRDLIIKSSKGKQQFTYRMAAEGTIETPTFNGVKLPSVDAKFSLSQAQIDHLQKMIGMIQDSKEKSGIKLEAEGEMMKFSFRNITTSDTYEIEYKLDTPVETPFTFVVDKEGLLLLPSADYELEVSARGLIQFHMLRDDNIDLNLYISKQRVMSNYRG